jgi:high-affinity Fe2+/Pb2+ permease
VTAPPPPDRPRDGRAVVVYTGYRLALLVGSLALGWLAGLRGALLLLAALLVSGVLSWFLLVAQRTAMGSAVERAVSRTRVRLHARTEAEDAYVDGMTQTRDVTRTGR